MVVCLVQPWRSSATHPVITMSSFSQRSWWTATSCLKGLWWHFPRTSWPNSKNPWSWFFAIQFQSDPWKSSPVLKNKTIITLVFVVKAETLKSTSFPAVINKWFLIFFWNFEVTLASPVRTKVSEDCASHWARTLVSSPGCGGASSLDRILGWWSK